MNVMCFIKRHQWRSLGEATIAHAKGNWPRGMAFVFPAMLQECNRCPAQRLKPLDERLRAIGLEEVEAV